MSVKELTKTIIITIERESMKKVLMSLTVFILFLGAASAQENNPKFSGLMFGDYFYNASSRNGADKDLNGFQFRRIYITTDYTISDNFSTRFRLESDQIGLKGGNTEWGVMVKDAWLKWKDIFNGSDLIFGISPTPAFDVSEGAWGHRYLEKTIMDLNHIVSSRDLGIDLKGKFDQGGTIKYWVKIGNNSGNAPEANKYKRFYGLLEFDPSPDFLITLYGDYASYPQVMDPSDNQLKNNSGFVGAAFLSYKQKGSFGLGAEGFIANRQNQYAPDPTSALQSQNGSGVSLWAYVNFNPTIQLVGRFDTFDPNSDVDKDGRNMILAGLQINPVKNVSITPNVEVFTYQADAPENGDKSDVTPRKMLSWG